MPVTRSNKGAQPRQEVPEEESSAATRTTESFETTVTATTSTAVEASDKAAKGKSLGKATSVMSSQATERTRKRRELEIRAKMARLELQEAQAAAKLARAELELVTMESDDDSNIEEPEGREESVHRWVDKTVSRMSENGGTSAEGRPGEALGKECPIKLQDSTPAAAIVVKTNGDLQGTGESDNATNETAQLADAIIKAISSVSPKGVGPPPAYMFDLPVFDGRNDEWLPFRTVYEDTAAQFGAAQNMARLRKALKGAARESVRSVLYSECTPDEIMEALRRRFGRPDALVLAELEKIRALPKITENAKDVCVFASTISNVIATIKGLRKPAYLCSPETVKVIIDKLPMVLRYRWYDFAATKEDPDLSMVADFLNREADRCGPYAAQESATQRFRQTRQAAHAAAEGAHTPNCPNCRAEHPLESCRRFLEMAVDDRWSIVKKSGKCFKCLKNRHRKENCKRPPCKKCGRWHHILLHNDGETQRVPARKENPDSKEVANNVRLTGKVNTVHGIRAYLKMVPVEIYGPKGNARIMALLDEGSTVTLLDSSVADKIGLHGPRDPLSLETVGGRIISKDDSMRVDIKVRGLHQSQRKKIFGARTIDGLRLTPQSIEKTRIEECAHLQKLVDKLHYEEEAPRLLIGQDNWELIVSKATRKGKRGQPAASLTHLGWVLHGLDGGADRRGMNFTCAHVSAKDEVLDQLIKNHFAIESLGVQPRRPSTDAEGRAVQILEKTTRRLDNGRFETGLLWKKDGETMPDNYEYAKNRLKNIERKLDRDPGLKAEYSRQVENLLISGYAEEVTHESSSARKWYLPHFAVTHPTKEKKRLVFDAAAKCHGKSLNDALLSGPDLLQSLFGVLLRFRQQPVAVVADIKEMFLQVKIREEDRESLRFLWRGDDRNNKPQEYRMTSVIFGAACSPSSAIYVKNKNAADFKEVYPEAARAVERNHYMDDYLHSFESEEEAVRVAKQVDAIHKKAKFELRGWASNREGVQKELTKEVNKEVELGSKEEKTLGLRWFTERDEMGFRTCLRNVRDIVEQKKTPTKRQVTSAVMSTFDPLGLASPILIQGKKLLQEIWRSGVEWDEKITAANESRWEGYLNDLQHLVELRIPRCINYSVTEGEMHVFTDASETAFACAVYWRRRRPNGNFEVTLLAGKARVTPLKPVSIPRLELQAALLGTRMAHSIAEELDADKIKKTFWTDSSTVLAWIKTDPRKFKAFVAHRLAEIEDTTRPQQWRWVPTKQNPADDATRDVPRDFDGHHRWFIGPEFLRKEEEEWPQQRSFKVEPTGEEKEMEVTAHVTKAWEPTPNPSRFSRWTRLLRATARIFQFIDLCRKKRESVNAFKKQEDPDWRKHSKKKAQASKKSTRQIEEKKYLPLEAVHLEKAEKILLQRSQRESFREELASLEKKKPFSKASKLSRIDIVVEEDGLIHLRGRINKAHIAWECRRPVVLDSKERVTQLLIRFYHEKFNHGNTATVMNEMRQKYWVLGLRTAVKSTVHQCQWCRVYKSAPQHLPIGDLPRERLSFGEPAFSCSGADYFGPMIVTVGRRHEKRWGALFTCLTTRAVHIELATSLSSDSMILALRRMAARRGMPKIIYTDNGTNFVKANKELAEAIENMDTQGLCIEAEKLGTQWKFIAPGAPNMGGAWERLVRSIKVALAVTLKERHPKEEVLHTLLLEAEHVVNSRPLTNVDDPEEEALTPNHFLIGRSCGAPRLGAVTDEDLKGHRHWKIAQRLADHFWARWVKEYLPTLTPRRVDGRTERRDLQCGDTVLIVDPTLPRNCWPRGRVVHTYPGPDGRTRVIDVRTAGGILKRPCSKAVLLVPGDNSRAGELESVRRETTSDVSNKSTSLPTTPADLATSQRATGQREATRFQSTENKSPSQVTSAAHEGEDVGDTSN